MCGFCQNPSVGAVEPDGATISVAVHETDYSNTPVYHDVEVVAGRTYRFRAWPHQNVKAVFMLLVDAGGQPIRRAVTNTGNNLETRHENLDVGELGELRRDTERRCLGDTHAEFIYKATETAVYKVGVSAAVDTTYPRSHFDSDLEFTLQWKGFVVDTGQAYQYSILGEQMTNGTLRFNVETVALPPLPPEQQAALLDLQSRENGVDYPEYLGYHTAYPDEDAFTVNKSARVKLSPAVEPFWHRDEHPCTWGGRHAGMEIGCCLRSDANGILMNASVTSVDLTMWTSVYRGDIGSENFRGHIPDSIGNLRSLRAFGIAASYVSGTLPAALIESTSLEFFRMNDVLVAGTIPDDFTSLKTAWLSGTKYLSGTIPSTIASVDSMRMTWLTHMSRLSGTVPSHYGHNEQSFLVYRGLPRVEGHLPAAIHPDHWAAAKEETIQSNGIGIQVWFQMALSGTIPESGAFCDGNSPKSQNLKLWGIGDSRISGTVPTCLFSGLPRLDALYLFQGRLSGTIPDLTNSSDLRLFRAERNDFEHLPTNFPPNVQQFMSSGNPRMDTSGHDLGQLLNNMHLLKDFSFASDDMVARSIEMSIQQGAIPDIGWSVLHPASPLDCRIGEPCEISLVLVIGISYVPMNSIGVTFDIRMDPNCTDLDEHILDLREHLFAIEEERETNLNRTTSATHTDYGHASWQSDMNAGKTSTQTRSGRRMEEVDPGLDAEVEAQISHLSGDITSNDEPQISLSEGLSNLVHIAPMADNWDGSYAGKLDFTESNELYESTASDRETLGAERLVAPNFEFTRPGRYRMRIFANGQVVHFHDFKLWHLNMHQIDCLDSRAFADETGARCQCIPGYAPPDPCKVGDRHCACYSCKSEYSEHHRSQNGESCVPCAKGETADEAGISCICSVGSYNVTQLGVITCVNEKFKDDLFSTAPEYTVQHNQFSAFHSTDNSGDSACLECPTDCLDCLGPVATIKPGFSLSNTARGDSDHASSCNIVTTDGQSVPTKCVSILSCRPDIVLTNENSYQCLGGELAGDHMKCGPGYEGQLCGTCSENFGTEDGNLCVSCDAATDPWKIFTWVVIAMVVVFLIGLVLMLIDYHIGHIEAKPEEQMPRKQSTTANPLSNVDDEQKDDQDDFEVEAGKDQEAQARTKLEVARPLLRSLVYVVLQPTKIAITYMQIASLLGAVLHFKFPPLLSQALAVFKPLIVAINGVIALQCIGIQDYYLVWLVEVFVVPGMFLAVIVLHYVYQRCLLKDKDGLAMTNLTDRLFFLLFLTYPPITNNLFQMLNCRQISATEDILVADYQVDCNDDTHRAFTILAWLMILCFSAAVPVVMMVLMITTRQTQQKQFMTPEWQFITRQIALGFGHDNIDEVRQCIIDVKLGNRYGFLVAAFKPGFFYWECFAGLSIGLVPTL
jgi:hypothetical protein